jgi:two-component system, LuxR family, response regulator FixJ
MFASPTHIFIVDDDKSFGRSLKRLLNAMGFAAECFGSARAFLDSVPFDQKGIAVVDIHMPEWDGFWLIDKMQELRYSMPVIVITGHTEAGSRDTAFQRGAVGFLQKPFNQQSLLDLIEAQEEAGYD